MSLGLNYIYSLTYCYLIIFSSVNFDIENDKKETAKKEKKYYAVVTEDQSQIYLTWDECREAVQGKGKKAKHNHSQIALKPKSS